MAGRAPLALLLLVSASPAASATLGIEASTDLRRRGISWSDGKPALEAFAALPIAGGLSLQAGAATLRGSLRHGGADLLVNGALRYTHQSDAWTLWAEIQGLGFAGVFTGASNQNYAQIRTNIARGIGPLQISASADWAPPQSAIGGSNLYLAARASTGIPGTPLTVAASIGHSTGSDDGTINAQRLRPGGNYTDYRLDADYIRGPLAFGASLTTASINAADTPPSTNNLGTRLLLRASIIF